MLPPEERLVGAEGLKIPLHRYIRDQLYWVLHAPRQTGKTSFLQSWMREINAGDAAIACYVSAESCQGIAEPERDLKDYITAAKDGVPVNPGSPFNIRAASAFLDNFSKDDIGRLFVQRTQETGQQITPEALDYVYDQSRGQPWIVNSLLQHRTGPLALMPFPTFF
jgi:hypothetical protein